MKFCELHRVASAGLGASKGDRDSQSNIWKILAVGRLNLNIDVAGEDLVWGTGCVLRDVDGTVVVVSTSRLRCNDGVEFAEASGLRRGLLMAWELGHRAIQAETD